MTFNLTKKKHFKYIKFSVLSPIMQLPQYLPPEYFDNSIFLLHPGSIYTCMIMWMLMEVR